jgi:hypothetical protein
MKAFRRELTQYLEELAERSNTSEEATICPHIEGYPGRIVADVLSEC